MKIKERNKKVIILLAIISLLSININTTAYADNNIDENDNEVVLVSGTQPSINEIIPSTVWGKMGFSGKQNTIYLASDGKYYATAKTKIAVGKEASANDAKVLKIDKKGIAKVAGGGMTTLASPIYGNTQVWIFSPSISVKKIELAVGDTREIELNGVPDGIPVAWDSSNQNVVQVFRGKCYGVGVGSSKVCAYVGGRVFKVNVKVTDKTDSTLIVNAISGKKTAIKGIKGANKLIYECSSNDIKIEKGKVVAQKTNGGVSANISDGHKLIIYGNEPTLGETSINIKIGQRIPVIPEGTHEIPIWKSNKPNIAVVSEFGMLIGQSEGQAKIKAKIGGKNVTLNVTVSNEVNNFNENKDPDNWKILPVVDNINGNSQQNVYYTDEGVTSFNIEKPPVINYYDVVIDPNNGEELTYKHLKEGIVLNVPIEPALKGYVFDGWYLEEELYDFSQPLRSNLVLKAHWRELNYTIVIDPNGGNSDVSEIDVGYTETVKVSNNNVEYSGYDFIGYSYRPDATVPDYNNGETFSKITTQNNDKIKFYMVWKPVKVALTVYHQQMELDGSTYKTVDIDYYQYTTGETIIPPINSYAGFTSPDEQSIEIKGDGTSTVIYQYNRNRYFLSLTRGTGIESVAGGGSYYYGQTVRISAKTKPDDNESDFYDEGNYRYKRKHSYVFWSWSDDNTDAVRDYVMPAGNTTLLAEANDIITKSDEQYFVKINKFEGVLTVTDSRWIPDGRDIPISATYESGFEADQGTGTYTVTEPLTVNVTAKKIKYLVQYNANGGTGSTESQYKTHGSTLILRRNNFTAPSGKYFKEWNTKANGSGDSYNAAASYTTNKAVTLYAQWEYPKLTLTNDTSEITKVVVGTTEYTNFTNIVCPIGSVVKLYNKGNRWDYRSKENVYVQLGTNDYCKLTVPNSAVGSATLYINSNNNSKIDYLDLYNSGGWVRDVSISIN